MTITRRALLQLAGLSLLPALAQADDAAFDAWAEKIHAATRQPRSTSLTADERATVAAMVDGILPRTDTPGALDVGVPAFIDVIVADWMTAAERDEFRAGLTALDARARAAYGIRWSALDPVQRDGELAWAERPADAAHVAKKAYRRLKGLALHGYLTSERVRKEVLKVNITPGHFRGAVPITAAPSTGGHAHA
ncbi:MAG: gluconate 2-dehydrogenase subunit 3 family protein [Gemmatimonadota bacterium]